MPVPPDSSGPFSTAFPAVFGIVFVIIVVGIIATIALSIYRSKRVIDSGHNPLTLDTDIALKVLDSQALASDKPAASVEERLAELDALHAKGAISDDEHAKARERILGSL